MALGIQELVSRLRAVLPTHWFPDDAPVLDSVLSGLAWGWSEFFGSLDYVEAQARIATATGVWLDAIAQDFLGSNLVRRTGQPDDDFRRLIRAELFRERATRAAIRAVLEDLTGRTPAIFEPANPTDTGGYGGNSDGGGAFAYGAAGGWGSLALPFQAFVTAFRPAGAGIASVAGYGEFTGGYGVGVIEYASLGMIAGRVTDNDINRAVASVLPASAICWTRISS